jgi:hypothetical protein
VKTDMMLFLCIWFSWRWPQWKYLNRLDAYSSPTNPKNFLRPVQRRSDIANLEIYRAKSGMIFVKVNLMFQWKNKLPYSTFFSSDLFCGAIFDDGNCCGSKSLIFGGLVFDFIFRKVLKLTEHKFIWLIGVDKEVANYLKRKIIKVGTWK